MEPTIGDDMATKLECIVDKAADEYSLQLSLEGGKGVHIFLKAKNVTGDQAAVCAFVTEAMKQAQAFGRADLKTEFAQLLGIGKFI